VRDWLTAFFMAWGMFCAVPCPCRRWDERQYPKMLLCLPLIGLLLGGLWALAAWGLRRLGAPGLFSAALLTALPCLLTGCIHLDGFLDCADAVLSRRGLEERRKILKDPHVGSFSVICLALLLLLAFSLLASADLRGRLLCAAFLPASVRAASAAAVLSFAPLESSGYAGMRERTPRAYRAAAWAGSALFALAPAALFGVPGLAAAAASLGAWGTILRCRKNLGGMSGDVSGAAVAVGELCGLAALTLL